VHQLPVIREALIQAMQQRYAANKVAKMPWLRIAQPPFSWQVKSNIIGLLGASALKALAKQAAIAYSPVLLGVYGFNCDAASYQQLFNQWLQQASRYPSAALMCHPALAIASSTDSSEQSQDAILAARQMEYQVLQQLDLAALCQPLAIQLSQQPSAI
jgi:hypothetical protein